MFEERVAARPPTGCAVWSGAALADLARLDDFYAAIDPDYADRVGRLAVRAARFLADHPQAGPTVMGEFRKWRVPGTRHLLLYRLGADGIEIVRVHHGKENWREVTP
ncbi:type II toxin-antitoxin system RelE/ParE family toxin [Sphingomonas sp. MMS24-JH45]